MVDLVDRSHRFAFVRDVATRWDLVAIVVVIGLLTFFAEASRGLFEPLLKLSSEPLSLDPVNLPFYAARTTLRMFAALALSLAFTFTYATWAAKSARAEKLLVPILDILQSVPILGFISITVVFFMSLVPGRVLGAEFAAIFAIFTSQAWNMAFSFYQSLRTVPHELEDAAASFRLSPWMRFWRLEVPFAMPALLWNMMMSMSGSWFFVVASESISVGHTNIALPGVGSYIALAIEQGSLRAIGWAIATMFIVILLYDQLIFRPLVVWGDRFRFDQEQGGHVPESWALTMLQRSRLMTALRAVFNAIIRWTSRKAPRPQLLLTATVTATRVGRRADLRWYLLLVLVIALAVWRIARMLIGETTWHEAAHVAGLATLTMLRVMVLIALASVVWVPIGIWVGLRPRATQIVQPVAQFLAAFPANLLFPLAVYGIVTWKLNPDVWLSPLMILGTQWYILFNVIAGAAAMPTELRYAAQNLGLRGFLWWRKVALPGVLPYYVTGAITASGGSWNAAIVAELASWRNVQVKAHGLGAYIAEATTAGDFHRIILGIATMSLFVVAINRSFWRPLYYFAERKYRLS
jgi:NitT/TauT family transport system permease protein